MEARLPGTVSHFAAAKPILPSTLGPPPLYPSQARKGTPGTHSVPIYLASTRLAQSHLYPGNQQSVARRTRSSCTTPPIFMPDRLPSRFAFRLLHSHLQGTQIHADNRRMSPCLHILIEPDTAILDNHFRHLPIDHPLSGGKGFELCRRRVMKFRDVEPGCQDS